MYDWDDTGIGDCTGAPEHVGIVAGVSKNFITVIEGNKGNAVGYRVIKVNGRYIRGYCVPDHAAKAGKDDNDMITQDQFDKMMEAFLVIR